MEKNVVYTQQEREQEFARIGGGDSYKCQE